MSSGNARANERTSSSGRYVPDGLFGLQRITMRVSPETASSMAPRSALWCSSSGTFRVRNPTTPAAET
jgi:hypothetical protein